MNHLQTVIGFSDSTDIDIQKLKTAEEFEHSLAILQLSFGRHYDIMLESSAEERSKMVNKIVEDGVACVVMTDAIYLDPSEYNWKHKYSEKKINLLCYANSIENAMALMALWLKGNQDRKEYAVSKIQHIGLSSGHLNRIVKPARLKE